MSWLPVILMLFDGFAVCTKLTALRMSSYMYINHDQSSVPRGHPFRMSKHEGVRPECMSVERGKGRGLSLWTCTVKNYMTCMFSNVCLSSRGATRNA